MAGCAAEHNTRKVGLGETGNTALTGRGRSQDCDNCLQGSSPINTTVCFGDVGPFGRNVEEVRRFTYRAPQTDHGEAIATYNRQDVGDAWGRISAESGRNAVGNDLYRETAGNCGTMGGVTTNIRSVYKGEGMRVGWKKEGGLVEPRGDREITSGHLGRNIVGS